MVKYVPDRGDLVWLDFNPQVGHEQAGKRPALTVSPKAYNEKTGLGLFCPITSHQKNYPFEVGIIGSKISGVILSDQVKSLDWRARGAELWCRLPHAILGEVFSKLHLLLPSSDPLHD